MCRILGIVWERGFIEEANSSIVEHNNIIGHAVDFLFWHYCLVVLRQQLIDIHGGYTRVTDRPALLAKVAMAHSLLREWDHFFCSF